MRHDGEMSGRRLEMEGEKAPICEALPIMEDGWGSSELLKYQRGILIKVLK
jgi:hypothetical protein